MRVFWVFFFWVRVVSEVSLSNGTSTLAALSRLYSTSLLSV